MVCEAVVTRRQLVYFCRTRRGGCRSRSERPEVLVGSAAMLVACAKSDQGVWRLFPVRGAALSFAAKVNTCSCCQNLLRRTRRRFNWRLRASRWRYRVASTASFHPAPQPCCLPHCCNGGGHDKSALSTEVVSGAAITEGASLTCDEYILACVSGTTEFCIRGEAGKLKVVLLIRGCVCRGRPDDTSAALHRLMREAEGYAAVAAVGSDVNSLGNVVLNIKNNN